MTQAEMDKSFLESTGRFTELFELIVAEISKQEPSREMSLAFTQAELAMMWFTRGVALALSKKSEETVIENP